MVILKVLLWLLIILLILLLLVLCLRIRFIFSGRWEESLDYAFSVGIGPLYITEQTFKNGRRGRVKKDHENHGLGSLKPFMKERFLKGVLRTIQAILAGIDDRELKLSGLLGFADPYYTGLLAAFGPLIPGFNVRLIFTDEVRDLEFKIAGRLSVGLTFYYLVRFLLDKESRKVWQDVRRQKKEKKIRKNATRGKNTVYSTVKE